MDDVFLVTIVYSGNNLIHTTTIIMNDTMQVFNSFLSFNWLAVL